MRRRVYGLVAAVRFALIAAVLAWLVFTVAAVLLLGAITAIDRDMSQREDRE